MLAHSHNLMVGGRVVPYLYGVDCASDIARVITERVNVRGTVLLVADENVEEDASVLVRHLSDGMSVETYFVAAEERRKTFASVEAIADHAVRHGVTRDSLLIAMGGGLVGNIAGLTASLLYRGMRFVHLPTTPIAAADSVVSLKQAVNLPSGKNLCGSYSAPSLIACDLRWLTSVPPAELMAGLAEMVKNVLAVTPHLESSLVQSLSRLRVAVHPEALADIVRIGIEAKAPLLEGDPHERAEALIFEYGHTVGHALEFTSRGVMGHGEAVAWGMLVAAETSAAMGLLNAADLAHHYRLVRHLGLPHPSERLAATELREVREVLGADNKRGHIPCAADEIPMVLLEALGSPVRGESGRPVVPVRDKVVMRALETVMRADSWPELPVE